MSQARHVVGRSDERTQMANGNWRKSAAEFGRGFTSSSPRTSGIISLAVLLVTGTLWLTEHLTKWPGGYLPWMFDSVWFLGMVTFFLNFHQMRVQRDAAQGELAQRLGSVRNRLTMTGLNQSILTRVELQYENYERQVSQEVLMLNASLDPIDYEIERYCVSIGPYVTEALDPERVEGSVMPGASLVWRTPTIDRVRVTDLLKQREETGLLVVKYRHASSGPWFRYTQPFTIRIFSLPDDKWTHSLTFLKGKHEPVL